MKTRILHTKMWEDEFFAELTPTEKLLFIYYITNLRIGLTGIYELSDRIISFETGLNRDQIEKTNEKFQTAGKIFFNGNWIFVRNANKLGGYNGEKISKAMENEVSLIPTAIYEYFSKVLEKTDTLSEGYDGVSVKSDTPINHKSEIINHKSEEKGIVKGKNISEEDFVEIAEKYQVPISFVRSKWDDLQNWCASKGKRYKDYKAALRDWVKRDAISIKKEFEREQGKVAIQT